MKIYFRVIPVLPLLAKAWHRGDADDPDLLDAYRRIRLPCPVVWYVMSLTGGPAGGRQCLRWMRYAASSPLCEGFIFRTNLYSLADLADRWEALHGFRDTDPEAERFWVEPGALVSPQADKSA